MIHRCTRAAVLFTLLWSAVSCGPPEGDEAGGGGGGDGNSPTADTSTPDVENPPRRAELLRTQGTQFELMVDGAWRPFFLNGINMGLARPGSDPGELPQDRETLRRWFEYCGQLGVNSIRLYTLQMPEFYEEFLFYQQRNPDRPLWLVQGIWLDEAAGDDYTAQTEAFTQDIRYTVDAVHGDAKIDVRFGKAYGTYRADVSSFTISYLIGRELDPYVVESTNQYHPDYPAFYGDYFYNETGSAMEIWITEMLDYTLAYSDGTHGTLRPITFSSWPTLDPLVHEIQPKDALVSAEDFVDIDLTQTKLGDKNWTGLYVSYHAYPYYPEFILYTPEYEEFTDAYGPNTYLGYLADLRSHYTNTPLVIGEYGVPSSRGVGKYASSGMHQGSHSEVDQGFINARLLENIVESGCAGGMLFALADEWFKTAWIVELMELPKDRRRTWKNVQNPEQNFGLVAYDPDFPGTRTMDADGADWVGSPVTEKNNGLLRGLWISHDAAYVYLRLDVDPAQLDFDSFTYYIGLDTVSREAGDTHFPDGVDEVADHGMEFVVRLDGIDTAEILVDTPYDTYSWWFYELSNEQKLRSVPNADGAYNSMFYLVNYEFFYNDEQLGPRQDQWVGKLEHGNGTTESSLFAARTDWQISWAHGFVEIRLPWGLLNFTDPSQLEVLFDDRDTGPTEVRPSDGIALTAVATTKATNGAPAQALDRLPATGHTTPYEWEPWDKPPYLERAKASFPIFRDAIRDLFAAGDGPFVGAPTYIPPGE